MTMMKGRTPMIDDHEPDDPLLEELRDYFARVDPVPPTVTEAARAVLGWRRLDADLAELLSDSTLEPQGLALTRGTGGPARSVSFSAGELAIDIEVHEDGARRELLGQLSPPSSARIEIQAADGADPAATETDSLGRFRVGIASPGSIRLRVTGRGAGGRPIETSWIRV